MVIMLKENRKPSTGELFAQAFSNVGQQAGQGVGQFLQGQQAQKMRMGQQQDTAKMLQQLTGQNFTGREDPELLKALATQVMKNQSKEQLWNRKESFLSNMFPQNGEQKQNQSGQMQDIPMQNDQFDEMQGSQGVGMQEQNQGRIDPANYTAEQILKATAADPNFGRVMQQQNDVSLREKREGKKEVNESYKTHNDYINKVYDQYEDSERKQAIIERMNQLNQNGELSESGAVNLLESLGLQQEWLKNPANEEYTKLALDLLGGGTLQADYGSRVLASEFKVSQQRIPSLQQTAEGRSQIAANIETMLLPSKLKKERMQYYLDKSERTGQPLPHDLRGKILRDIKPQLDEAYDKFKQRNGRYKVRPGTEPDDNAVEKYWYLSNGDLHKAKKMMKEDNYNVQ